MQEEYFKEMPFLHPKKKIIITIPSHLTVELAPQRDGGLIFDTHNGSIYTLSCTAALIISFIKDNPNGHSLEEVITKIGEIYDALSEEVENDLIEFLCHLKTLSIEVKNV